MTGFQPSLSRAVHHGLPTPIALPAQRFEDAQGPLSRAAHLLDCVDSTVRLLALLATADLASRGGGHVALEEATRSALLDPRPARWWALLEAAAGGYGAAEGEPFLPHLHTLLTDEGSDSATWRQATTRLVALWDDPGLDRAALVQDLQRVTGPQATADLATMLGALGFLADTVLLLPLDVLEGPDRKTVLARRLHGARPAGQAVAFDMGPDGELVAGRPALLSLDRDRALGLWPWVAGIAEAPGWGVMATTAADGGLLLMADGGALIPVESGDSPLTLGHLLERLYASILNTSLLADAADRIRSTCGTLPAGPEVPAIYKDALLLRSDATRDVLLAGDEDAWEQLWISVLAPHRGQDAREVRAAWDLAEALAEPSSDRLVPVVHFGWAASIGRFVLTSMAEPGTTLARRVAADGALAPAQALPIARDIIDAVAALRAAGLGHVPVHGASVVLGGDGRARLSTFPLGDDPGGGGAGLVPTLALAFGGTLPEALGAALEADDLSAARKAIDASMQGADTDHPAQRARERLAAMQATVRTAQAERARRADESTSSGELDAAVIALEELAEAAWSPSERVGALLRAADLYSGPLGDAAAARSALEAALAADPTCAAAATGLEADAEAREDWQRLSELLLDRFQAATDDEARVDALRRLRPVFEERLGDVDAAFFVLRKLLDLDTSEGRLDEIERLAEAAGHWDDLVMAYDTLAQRETGPAAATLATKAALVLLEKQGKGEEALTRLQAAADAAPEHSPTLEALAKALAAAGRGVEGARLLTRVAALLDGDEKAAVLARAAGAAEAAESWSEAILHHQARAALLSPVDAAAVWVHVGSIQGTHLASASMARAAFEHALTLTPANDEAFDGLEDIARATGDTALLRATLERRVAAASGAEAERGALEHQRALADEAGLDADAQAALMRRQRALGGDDGHLLDTLLTMAREAGRWDEAVELLAERAGTLTPDASVPVLLEQASILADQLGAPVRASRVLEVAIERREGDPAVQEALIDAYRASQQWPRLVSLLEARAVGEGSDERRAALLNEAAHIASRHLKDDVRAIALYETALESHPNNPVAARELANIYLDQTQGARGLPLAQVWASNVDAETDPEEALEAWLAVGRAADQMLRHDAAAEAYTKAVALGPSSVDGRVGLAAALAASGHHDAAIDAWRAALDLQDLPDAVRSRAQTALGELAMKAGSTEESRALLERAHAQNPQDEKVLRDLVAACDRLQDWAAAVRYRMELSKIVPDRVERGAVLMQAGDMAHDALKDVRAAIEAYRAAQVNMPSSKATAARLLRLFLDAQEYEEAIETLRRLIELEEDPKKKGSHRFTMALIYRDHLRDDRRAVAYLNETLDDDPLRLEAFESLDAILVRRKAWEEQAESYERMLERIGEIPGQEALAFRLLRNQADILSSVRQMEPAIFALERARALRPQDADTRFALARLLEQDDVMVDDAIAEYQTVIQIDGSRSEAYKALRRLYTRTRAADAAWCACGVLSLFGQADEKEQAYYEAHRQGALKVAHTIKSEDTWPRHLYADGQDPQIGALLLGVYRALPERFETDTFQALGLTERNHIDLRVRTSFSSFAGTIPRILGVTRPEFYLSAGAKGIRRVHIGQPALVLGPDVHDGLKGKRLRFTLGKALAYLHPQHLVATVLPAQSLQAALEAAYLLLTGNEEEAYHAPETVQDWFRALGRAMPQGDRAALRPNAELLFRTGSRPDVAAWQAQVELTANHAGLLLCNDIEVAIECLEREPRPLSGLSVKDKTKDLVRYALAPRYHVLRQTLGIAIADEESEAKG